ncbi:transferrin-binding protein-like solute binding protein [Frederiksenia canicola]
MCSSLKKTKLALLFPLLLTACAGKGSFDSAVVKNDDPSALSQGNASTEPNAKPKENTPPDSNAPENMSPEEAKRVKGLGFGVAIPRRNIAQHDKEGNPLPPYYKGETIGTAEPYVEISTPQSTNDEVFKPKDGFENILLDVPYSRPPESEGDVSKPHVLYEGKKGRIYYRAENTAKALPVNQVVSYKGIWRFVTDARPFTKDGQVRDGYKDFEGRDGYVGSSDGGSSYDEYIAPNSGGGHFSEFTADFNTKKLTGKLIKANTKDIAKSGTARYAIDADIKDNRFYGKATALDKSNKGVKYFYANSDKVEGGFYGMNANELAGSFLTNDNSVFAVFGAKSEKMTNDIMVDAFKINIEENEDIVKSNLNTYFDISKLVIDGQEVPLANGETTLSSGDKISVSACCGDLKSVKFGTFIHKSERHVPIEEEEEDNFDDEETLADTNEELADNEGADEGTENENDENISNLKPEEELVYTKFGKHLFIQGHRTPTSALPTDQTFTYEGNWQGHAAGKKIAPVNFSPYDSKAKFVADFAAKKVTGELIHNAVPVVLIESDIDKNGFKGYAKTGEFGITLDKGNTLGVSKMEFSKAIVEGAFYGKNAEEIGGSVYAQDPKFGAVFGGKKVENKEK